MNKIFKVQNRAIRIINFEDNDVDTNLLYKSNEILILEDLIKLQNILHVHDYLNNSLPDLLSIEQDLIKTTLQIIELHIYTSMYKPETRNWDAYFYQVKTQPSMDSTRLPNIV